jgi:hypothetical protein
MPIEVLVLSIATPIVWLLTLGRLAASPDGRHFLGDAPSGATQREIRETHPNTLAVASIVVAVIAFPFPAASLHLRWADGACK